MSNKGGRPKFSLVESLGHIEINKRINADSGLIKKKLDYIGIAGLLRVINEPLKPGQEPEDLSTEVTSSLIQLRDAWILGRYKNDSPKEKEKA